ncbi:glycosyltransferase family 2 protein [Agarivorans sp. MS3-6]
MVAPKIKLIAIAKDEAAYLPEWIHHHLYFGFSEIHIMVNRTEDNTKEILSSISKCEPRLTWETIDWIEYCPDKVRERFQAVAYAKGFYDSKHNGNCSHILFLDIDEFWVPRDFSRKIEECVMDASSEALISFQWMNDLGDAKPFSRFSNPLNGELSRIVKTLLPISADVKEFRPHVPILKNVCPHLLADGSAFIASEKVEQAVHPKLSHVSSSFIFHRLNRSQTEYISLLFRGNPDEIECLYKLNRNGFGSRTSNLHSSQFDDRLFSDYTKSFSTFLSASSLDKPLSVAKDFVLARYQTSLEALGEQLDRFYKPLLTVFRGVDDQLVISAFQKYRAEKVKSRDDAELLKSMAADAAQQSLPEAIEYLKKAQKIRPGGKIIAERLTEYKKLLVEQNLNRLKLKLLFKGSK